MLQFFNGTTCASSRLNRVSWKRQQNFLVLMEISQNFKTASYVDFVFGWIVMWRPTSFDLFHSTRSGSLEFKFCERATIYSLLRGKGLNYSFLSGGSRIVQRIGGGSKPTGARSTQWLQSSVNASPSRPGPRADHKAWAQRRLYIPHCIHTVYIYIYMNYLVWLILLSYVSIQHGRA